MKEWTTEEIRILRSQSSLGAELLAELLGRSVQSVKQAAKRHRISLRRRGSRSGLLLGQPRGKSWREQVGADPRRLAAIREEALSGELDLSLLESRVRSWLHPGSVELCPRCVARPIERQSSGLCEVCHNGLLAEAHRDEAQRRASRRDLDAARQEKARSDK